MDLVVSSISQGILWGVLSLGLFISFRILNIADMTTEGSFPLGAATCVILIQQGVNPADTPITLANKGVVYVNEEKAKKLGITIPESILKDAQKVTPTNK